MSDDESEALFTSSPEREGGVTVRRSRNKSRSESRRSHVLFLAVLVGALVVVTVMVAIALGVGITRSQATVNLPRDPARRAEALLTEYPVIDG